MTVNTNGATMSHTFTGLSVPSTPTQVRLHAGLADGQSALNENPMLFGGSAITAANFYNSTDGPMWDDDRIFVSTALLPAGTTSRTNSISLPSTNGDCLAWAYAALAYR